jgi:uncharacterized phage-associated protein
VEFSEKALYVINITWDFLKDINALNLSSWTHESNSPWDKAFKKGVNAIVDPNDMAEYFSKFISKKENNDITATT